VRKRTGRLNLPKQVRRLGNFRRNAPRVITREQLAGGSSAGLVLAIDESECLHVVGFLAEV
jgi:hypothetical protein